MTPFWIALAAAIIASMAGQVLLKSGAVAEGGFIQQLFRPATIIGFGIYGGSAVLYIVALRKIPMSVALPCTAASYVVAALIGYQFFGEALGPQKLAALALICFGVVLLATA